MSESLYNFNAKGRIPVVPLSYEFKDFAKASCQHHGHFYHILKLSAEDLYQTLHDLQKFNINELIEFFRSDYFGRAIQKPIENQNTKEIFFKKMMNIFKNIKSSDMPNFENIIKDKNFKEQLKNYKIQILKENLTL